jgi:hypothetical protein
MKNLILQALSIMNLEKDWKMNEISNSSDIINNEFKTDWKTNERSNSSDIINYWYEHKLKNELKSDFSEIIYDGIEKN